MENLNEIVNIMGNGFFPIVCCGFLFYLLKELTKALNEIKNTLTIMNERMSNLENRNNDD